MLILVSSNNILLKAYVFLELANWLSWTNSFKLCISNPPCIIVILFASILFLIMSVILKVINASFALTLDILWLTYCKNTLY